MWYMEVYYKTRGVRLCLTTVRGYMTFVSAPVIRGGRYTYCSISNARVRGRVGTTGLEIFDAFDPPHTECYTTTPNILSRQNVIP